MLVGYVLTFLFAMVSPLWTALAALIMALFASREIVARQKRRLPGIWRYGLGTACTLLAAGTVTMFALLTQLRPDPWYHPRYALPLLGMILGNTMTGISLGLDVLTNGLVREMAFFQKLPPCLIGIEACASSHHWSRELQTLGHTVRLMPPAYVKPYVKRQKNDATDAEAICEAVTRPNMRFVPTKTVEQQSCLMLHRARHLFIRQQTAVINSIRAYLAEFGIVAPVGRRGVERLLEVVADPTDDRLPEMARACLAALGSQYGTI